MPVKIEPTEVLKKSVWIIFGVILLFVFLWVIRQNRAALTDTWVCEEGKWVKIGRPTAPRPKIPCRQE